MLWGCTQWKQLLKIWMKPCFSLAHCLIWRKGELVDELEIHSLPTEFVPRSRNSLADYEANNWLYIKKFWGLLSNAENGFGKLSSMIGKALSSY
jgi:hypothetical protein